MPFSRLVRFRNRIVATCKWCLSFRKKNWELSDYPIGITEQDPDPNHSAPRFSQHHYTAYIINWAVFGTGDTAALARDSLQQNFEIIKKNWEQEGKTLIRPGKNGPIEFALREKVSTNEVLSNDFIQRVLGLEWAWISDESSLWDFHLEQTALCENS